MLDILNSKTLLEQTIHLSLFVQIITTILSLQGFTYKLNKEDEILKGVLGIETFVQIIEAVFYIWVILALKRKENLTRRRYIDWMITTPIMLISTIIYMDYLSYKQNKQSTTELNITNYFKENKKKIAIIVILNALMLLFGYLGEIGMLDKSISIPIGFIFFFAVFHYIYQNFAIQTNEGKLLFYFMFFIWALYGIADMMNFNTKNVMYNMLDVVAKNFYGLFIYYQISKLGK
jgi:hypothetical protein